MKEGRKEGRRRSKRHGNRRRHHAAPSVEVLSLPFLLFFFSFLVLLASLYYPVLLLLLLRNFFLFISSSSLSSVSSAVFVQWCRSDTMRQSSMAATLFARAASRRTMALSRTHICHPLFVFPLSLVRLARLVRLSACPTPLFRHKARAFSSRRKMKKDICLAATAHIGPGAAPACTLAHCSRRGSTQPALPPPQQRPPGHVVKCRRTRTAGAAALQKIKFSAGRCGADPSAPAWENSRNTRDGAGLCECDEEPGCCQAQQAAGGS